MENNGLPVSGGGRRRVLVVGGGFAGFTCARELEKRLGPDDAELLDTMVTFGIREARRIGPPTDGRARKGSTYEQ